MHDSQTSPSNYLNYGQVAALLNLPIGTVYSLVSRRKIPHIRIGQRIVRFKVSDILAWVEELSLEGGDA